MTKLTAKKEYSFEEVFKLNHAGGHYEMVNGELVEKSGRTFPHGKLLARVGAELGRYIEATHAGEASIKATYILCREPKLLRFPDISFISKARMPVEGPPDKSYWEFVPDLAIEIISPEDEMYAVYELAAEYIERGVKEVWLIVPAGRAVIIYRSFEEQRTLTVRDKLESAEILPGFSMAVSELFG